MKNCFSHSIEFLYFVTEAYICLDAVEMLGFSSVSDELNEPPTEVLDRIAGDILKRIWVKPDIRNILKPNTRKGYCLCEDGNFTI